MTYRALAIAGAAILSVFSFGEVNATTIGYAFIGTADYVLNGIETDGNFIVQYSGDTSNVTFAGGEYTNQIAPGLATFTTPSGTVTLLGDVNAVVDNNGGGGFVGFAQLVFGPPEVVSVEAISGAPFASYDLQSSFPLTTGGLSVADAVFQTSGGALEFKSITAMGFEASVVPEPATWAMVLAGFAGIGYVKYRRRAILLGA